jgi:hypothetical protein
MTFCYSCAAPLNHPDFKSDNDEFCRHCLTDSGDLRTREEILVNVARWMQQWQVDTADIVLIARANTYMHAMPAWADAPVKCDPAELEHHLHEGLDIHTPGDFCNSCGQFIMPPDPTRPAGSFCDQCTNAVGSLLPRIAIQKGLVKWFLDWEPALTQAVAEERATKYMEAMPAWSDFGTS